MSINPHKPSSRVVRIASTPEVFPTRSLPQVLAAAPLKEVPPSLPLVPLSHSELTARLADWSFLQETKSGSIGCGNGYGSMLFDMEEDDYRGGNGPFYEDEGYVEDVGGRRGGGGHHHHRAHHGGSHRGVSKGKHHSKLKHHSDLRNTRGMHKHGGGHGHDASNKVRHGKHPEHTRSKRQRKEKKGKDKKKQKDKDKKKLKDKDKKKKDKDKDDGGDGGDGGNDGGNDGGGFDGGFGNAGSDDDDSGDDRSSVVTEDQEPLLAHTNDDDLNLDILLDKKTGTVDKIDVSGPGHDLFDRLVTNLHGRPAAEALHVVRTVLAQAEYRIVHAEEHEDIIIIDASAQ